MTQVAAVKGEGAPGRKVNWTAEEDNELRRLIGIHGKNKWSDIAKGLVGKQPKQCRRRWQNCLSVTLKTGEWTLEVRPPRPTRPTRPRPAHAARADAGACSGPAGPARGRQASTDARIRSSCVRARARAGAEQEDAKLMEAHKIYHNQWTQIAKIIGGRTDNAVKNRWTALNKQQEKSRALAAANAAAAGAVGAGGGGAIEVPTGFKKRGRKITLPTDAQAKPWKPRDAAEGRSPLKIDIPGAEGASDLYNLGTTGLQSVRFSPNEATVLEMVYEQLGQLTRTTNYRLLSTRSAENGESLMPPMVPASAHGQGLDAGFRTPSMTPFLNDPKLHKTISREVLALLDANPYDSLVQPATESTAAASFLECDNRAWENPLSSTAIDRRHAAAAGTSDGGSGRAMARSASGDCHRKTCAIIQQAQQAVAASNGFYRAGAGAGVSAEDASVDLAHGFSPNIMPATARIMQKLYAYRTGLTPKDVNEVKRTNSINFRQFMKNQEASGAHANGADADADAAVGAKRKAPTGNSVTFDMDEQLLSPLKSPLKKSLRRSPRLPGRAGFSPAVIIGEGDAGGSAVEDLIRVASDVRQQDLESFLPALAMRLPEDPPKEIFQVPYVESDYAA